MHTQLPDLRVAGTWKQNLNRILCNPRFCAVPLCRIIDSYHYGHLPEPDGIAVHEGTAHSQRVDVAVCLKQCSGVQNECMTVDIVEQQVTMLLGIILRQIWRWGILDSLCEDLTKAEDLAKSLCQ